MTSTRVAIYTRKSTDEGLDQAFTSLDAQRQLCESFIASKAELGWVVLPERYDDGGFSGGTTDRPAFERLCQAVAVGSLDVVVVYKLDRLSRRQLDLLKTLDFFEQHGVRFVSITEDFNTSTPMGRFALSMMGAIAQLEREQIAARTRDKMSAQRRKGMWTGGRPVLGYNVVGKRMVVNEIEATQVRTLFELSAGGASIREVALESARRGWTTKTHVTPAGKVLPGSPFTKGSIHRHLTNPIYLGKVHYHGRELHDGQHQPIISPELWDAVQARLVKDRAPRRSTSPPTHYALLAGLITCAACGSTMGPHFSTRGGKRYMAYACRRYQLEGASACPGSRVPAHCLETFVMDRLGEVVTSPALAEGIFEEAQQQIEHRRPALKREVEQFEAEVVQLRGEQSRLVDALATAGNSPAIMERLRATEVRLVEFTGKLEQHRAELATVDRQVDTAQLRETLAEFTGVWDALTREEQGRMIALLIRQVRYDGRTTEVEVAFHGDILKELARSTS